jgi:hypothetical protein
MTVQKNGKGPTARYGFYMVLPSNYKIWPDGKQRSDFPARGRFFSSGRIEEEFAGQVFNGGKPGGYPNFRLAVAAEKLHKQQIRNSLATAATLEATTLETTTLNAARVVVADEHGARSRDAPPCR